MYNFKINEEVRYGNQKCIVVSRKKIETESHIFTKYDLKIFKTGNIIKDIYEPNIYKYFVSDNFSEDFLFEVGDRIVSPSGDYFSIFSKNYIVDDDIKVYGILCESISDVKYTNIPEQNISHWKKVDDKLNIIPFDVFKKDCPNNCDNYCLHYYKDADLNDELIDCEEINCPHYHFYKISYKYHLTNE